MTVKSEGIDDEKEDEGEGDEDEDGEEDEEGEDDEEDEDEEPALKYERDSGAHFKIYSRKILLLLSRCLTNSW